MGLLKGLFLKLLLLTFLFFLGHVSVFNGHEVGRASFGQVFALKGYSVPVARSFSQISQKVQDEKFGGGDILDQDSFAWRSTQVFGLLRLSSEPVGPFYLDQPVFFSRAPPRT